ncbi:MAG TPA: alpha/beta hydrolase-fold protein, partial [Gemmatimonadaceae bacterium]|nr:alpha/beta hydrolase-fold protein [Gemmatimonadaceae bacterium]
MTRIPLTVRSTVLALALAIVASFASPLPAQQHDGGGGAVASTKSTARADGALPPHAVRAGTVTVDTVSSAALATRKQYVVYLPPSYADSGARRYPVAYYLHGHTGNEWDWVRAGHLATTLDSLIAAGMPEMIVVMPDGDDGWYTTWDALPDASACRADTARAEPAASYCVPWPHYDDYIARDLVARVDSTWRTLPVR